MFEVNRAATGSNLTGKKEEGGSPEHHRGLGKDDGHMLTAVGGPNPGKKNTAGRDVSVGLPGSLNGTVPSCSVEGPLVSRELGRTDNGQEPADRFHTINETDKQTEIDQLKSAASDKNLPEVEPNEIPTLVSPKDCRKNDLKKGIFGNSRNKSDTKVHTVGEMALIQTGSSGPDLESSGLGGAETDLCHGINFVESNINVNRNVQKDENIKMNENVPTNERVQMSDLACEQKVEINKDLCDENKKSGDQNNETDFTQLERSHEKNKTEKDVDFPHKIESNFNTDCTRNLRNRSNRRLVPERLRQRRQTMQDMARPLKHWLYRNRNNPYPSKGDKMQLAGDSNMTLTQVSNWFANARRRLKNTVREPDVTWSRRIKMYNNCVEGNAELLSVSSDDSMWDLPQEEDSSLERGDEIIPSRDASIQDGGHWTGTPSTAVSLSQNRNDSIEASAHFSNAEEENCKSTSPKYEGSILHRYLNDTYEQSLSLRNVVHENEKEESRNRNPSGSLSSHDYEDVSTTSSSPTHNSFEDQGTSFDLEQWAMQWENLPHREDEIYWKEISAALALTSLARARTKICNQTGS